MLPHLVLRDETAADAAVIAEVTIAAFRTLAISNHTEQFIIEALRNAKALIISLVAELDGQVVGHIAFSPVTVSGDTPNWYAIGPVSVLPEYQRQGIGSALITAGLERLKQLNASGCCLVGHPEYYEKFGFKNTDTLVLEGIPPEVFFVLSFGASMPHGTVCFHSAFGADGSK
ncbi:MAG: N-acetyltransferase [Desulfobulbus sp.]|nr:N-acetyltransferase [Desulfobulbus sp.]